MSRTGFDFSAYIAEHTRDFVGREWVFAELDAWLADPKGSRFFIITGEPGIGKTAIAARLTQTRDISAYHFCDSHRAETVDPLSFACNLADQLMNRDDFALSFLRSHDIHVEAEQNIKSNCGTAINIKIETLSIGAQSPLIVFNRLIYDPLRASQSNDADRQLVIVVDALDEAVQHHTRETIVTLLTTCEGLPPRVRFILTSRPDSEVLRRFDLLPVQRLHLDASREDNMEDASKYAFLQLTRSAHGAAAPPRESSDIDALADRLANASQGNFLYLDLVLRSLPQSHLFSDEGPTLPSGLAEAYREFMRTRIGSDISDWRKQFRPILAVLVAAKAPLTLTQLQRLSGIGPQPLNDALFDMHQFLDSTELRHDMYQIYHSSVSDFLRRKGQAREFWIDVLPIHRRIGIDYIRRFRDRWNQCDSYGLRYLPTHLYEAQEATLLEDLLFDAGWMKAKLVRIGVNALIADYELLPNSQAAALIRDSLRLSAAALQCDTEQLTGQLTCRLGQSEISEISQLLVELQREQEEPWLRPLTTNLQPPGGPLQLTLEGHNRRVNALAVAPDGRRVASGSRDGQIRIWDIGQGITLRILRGHAGDVDAVSVSPDGQKLVSGSRDNTVKVWDLESGKELSTLRGHTRWIRDVAVTMDNKFVVSGSSDGSIRIWSIETGKLQHTLRGHTSEVSCIELTRDGRKIISGSYDRTLRIWDVQHGRELRSLEAHYSGINDMAMMPDGRHLVTASNDTTLKVWDLGGLKAEHILDGHTRDVGAVAVTPDGDTIISSSWDRSVRLWDAVTGKQVACLPDTHGSGVVSLGVTKCGQYLISASHDNTLKVWDLRALADEASETAEHYVKVLAVSRDGTTLVTCSLDYALQIWDLNRNIITARLVGHTDLVEHALIVQDGDYVISGSRDHTVRVWNVQEEVVERRLPGHGGWISALALTPDERLLVSVSLNTLSVWEWRTGTRVATFTGDSLLSDCAVSPDGRRMVVAGGFGKLHFLNLEGCLR